MDFELKPEQEQLRDMLQRYVRKDYAFDTRRKIIASPEGFSREVWKRRRVGLPGSAFPRRRRHRRRKRSKHRLMESLGPASGERTSHRGARRGMVRDDGSAAQRDDIFPPSPGARVLAPRTRDAGALRDRNGPTTGAVRVRLVLKAPRAWCERAHATDDRFGGRDAL